MKNNMPPPSASSSAASCLDALLSQSSSRIRGGTERPENCCCGNLQCAYLLHNNAALEGLENQLENAARIGQVRTCLAIMFDPSSDTFHFRTRATFVLLTTYGLGIG